MSWPFDKSRLHGLTPTGRALWIRNMRLADEPFPVASRCQLIGALVVHYAALKLLPESFACEADRLRHSEREARAVAR